MEQQKLSLDDPDDIYEALKKGCRAIALFIGKDPRSWSKEIGSILWPHKSPEDARDYLLNCLDRDRKEKLDIEQVLWIIRKANDAGCHIPMAFICDDTNYQRTTPIVPQQQVADLQKRYIAAVKEIRELSIQMDKKLAELPKDAPLVRLNDR